MERQQHRVVAARTGADTQPKTARVVEGRKLFTPVTLARLRVLRINGLRIRDPTVVQQEGALTQ